MTIGLYVASYGKIIDILDNTLQHVFISTNRYITAKLPWVLTMFKNFGMTTNVKIRTC